MLIEALIFITEGYLLGSIPSAVWIGIYLFGKDVRNYGSKNAGATNTFRVLGKQAGTLVLLADILKGYLAYSIPFWFEAGFQYPGGRFDLPMVCGLAAVAGHLYPVFAGFKGGKGVATALGIMLAAAPLTSLMAASIFLIIWLTWNYISLASMTSALSFPLFLFLFFEPEGYALPIASILLPLLIVYSHRSNIRKLLKGEESKMYLISRKSK